MDVTWYVCDFVSGDVIGELPLSCDTVTRRIATETSQALTLPTADPRCPTDWHTLLVPGKTMIVLCMDDAPVQGWAVTEDLEFGAATVPVNVTTLETCLARTNVPDYEPDADTDLSQVAANLCAILDTRFGIDVEWTACGTTTPDVPVYDSTVDQTLLAALNDLSATEKGPEWRIFPRWADETTKHTFLKVIQISGRIGTDRVHAIFDLDTAGRGTIDTYTRNVSYGSGKGATMLIGTSEGSGSSRPMTDPMYSNLVDLGWPVWEERYNFTGLDDAEDFDAALASRTRATLAQREQGATVWKISGNDNAPFPGRDYQEGDTVHVRVEPQGKQDPVGGTCDPRVIGWDINPDTAKATPLLWDIADPDGTS